MLRSLEAIKRLKSGDMRVLKDEKWLMYLALTPERNVNLERLNSMEEMKHNYVLDYVERTLLYLEKVKDDTAEHYISEQVGTGLNTTELYILEETLKWAETAKSGLPHQRREWIAKGYNLFVHNIGSAKIYDEYARDTGNVPKTAGGARSSKYCVHCISNASGAGTTVTGTEIICTLIFTHGLIGQYIRGEVPLDANEPLYRLALRMESQSAAAGSIPEKIDLRKVLMVLNYCIVSAVDERIWSDICKQAEDVICKVLEGRFGERSDLKERLRRLRAVSIKNGEAYDAEYERIFSDPRIVRRFEALLDGTELWYVEAALFDFSFEEFVKIFLLTALVHDRKKTGHISFELMMKELYYQHDGKKRVNIYKKRIIEKYLSDNPIEAILEGNVKENPHVSHEITTFNFNTTAAGGVPDHADNGSTLFFNFRFSPAGGKLIEFCTEAEKSDVLYESAVVLLFDLFGLRRDKYDRFYEEERYLTTMNQSIDYKKIILDYITGGRILDIGPGGGALMDMIEERFPEKQVLGVDIAENVLDALKKKKQLEGRRWDVVYGDALHLDQYMHKESADTIIYCSILHELYSYIEYDGRKFNHDTLACALKSAFEVLSKGGRIIIRDGIMTEPVEQKRIIHFLSEDGMEFLERYCRDFRGRQIQYAVTGHNEVIMPVNDTMEFLYTYTWGEKSYVHEVNEQFGYFTPSGFREFITGLFGNKARITEFRHFLQDGYSIALSPKIRLFDENRNAARLPDSTCIIVIEKV
jgi:SAM-dependent methyltransferase